MKILITGGSGYLGRGILSSLADAGTHEYIVYSRDEYKQDVMKSEFPDARYILGDIRDYDRLIMALRGVSMVIHTGAIKFIPDAEFNVDECIAVNIEGSRNVLRASLACGVSSVIGISTDKACQPINTYGMTKAIMERMFGEYSTRIHTGLVRYGNVIGSTGSVIPKFQQSLAEKGYLSLTDARMTRYWITLEEAVGLIKLSMSVKSGSIIIPKPRAMRMIDLALALAPSMQEIRIIGQRPGEKMHESLMHEQESVRSIDRCNYYELLRVSSKIKTASPAFELCSNNPEGGWISIDEMRELINSNGAVGAGIR